MKPERKLEFVDKKCILREDNRQDRRNRKMEIKDFSGIERTIKEIIISAKETTTTLSIFSRIGSGEIGAVVTAYLISVSVANVAAFV